MPPPPVQSTPVPPQSPAVGNDAVVFDRSAARRTEDVVRYVESTYRLRSPRRRVRPTAPTAGTVVQMTSTVAARTGASVSSGTATVMVRAAGTILSTGESISVVNLVNKIVASGAYGVALWAGGDWWLVAVGDCANLS